MTLLIIGLTLFIFVHLIPSMGGLRAVLAGRIGEQKYKGIIGLVALVGLALTIWGYHVAPVAPLWIPPMSAGFTVTAMMLVSTILFVASIIPSNIKRVVRHPQLSAVILFSGAHLLVNGDLASIILFGSLLLFSVVAVISALIRKLGDNIGPQPASRDIKVLIIGAVVFAALVFLHPYLFGVPALNFVRPA